MSLHSVRESARPTETLGEHSLPAIRRGAIPAVKLGRRLPDRCRNSRSLERVRAPALTKIKGHGSDR